jgi:hypothetical protein
MTTSKLYRNLYQSTVLAIIENIDEQICDSGYFLLTGDIDEDDDMLDYTKGLIELDMEVRKCIKTYLREDGCLSPMLLHYARKYNIAGGKPINMKRLSYINNPQLTVAELHWLSTLRR